MKLRTAIFTILLFASATKALSQYPFVIIETNMGTMKLKLYENTFRHSDNFVKLVKEGYYNGQLFHRVIKDFMIQSGDDKSINAQPSVMLGTGGKTYTIPAEFFPEYYHKKGALAAARQGDNINPKKESSGSQFYIVQGQVFDTLILAKMEQKQMHLPFTYEQKKIYSSQGGSPHLDYQYTVFGELVEGFNVLEAISKVPVDSNNRPTEDVKILKMYTSNK